MEEFNREDARTQRHSSRPGALAVKHHSNQTNKTTNDRLKTRIEMA
jgi:hypothetical protein